MFQVCVKLEDFCAERFSLNRGCLARLYDLDPRDRKVPLLFETSEAHPLQTLQDQIRCAIAAPYTGANQSDSGEMKKILRRVPLRAARLD